MAPALTEAASHTQNLKLPYSPPVSSQSTPTSPITIVDSVDERVHKLQLQPLLSKSDQNGDLYSSKFNKKILANLSTDIVNISNQVGKGASKSIILGLVLGPEKKAGKLQNVSFCYGTNDVSSVLCRTMNSVIAEKNDEKMGLVKTNSVCSTGSDDKLLEDNPKNLLKSYALDINQSDVISETLENERKCSVSDEVASECMQNRANETQSRHAKFERRADHLLRRLQRMQAQHTHRHIQEQLMGFVQTHETKLNTCVKNDRTLVDSSSAFSEYKTKPLLTYGSKSVSTTKLTTLVRKLGSGENYISSLRTTTQLRENNSENVNTSTSVDISKLSPVLCDEIDTVSCSLQSTVQHLECMLDPDATDASSGGESCDESVGYDDTKPRITPIHKRVEWKWATERAAVAARWTWLQSQICDLEYRIRKQSEVYRQLRTSKGSVNLGRTGQKTSVDEFETSKSDRLPTVQTEATSLVDTKATALTAAKVGSVGSGHNGRYICQVNGFLSSSDSQDNMTSLPQQEVTSLYQQELDCSSQNGISSNRESNSAPLKNCSEGVTFSDPSCTAARSRPLHSYRKRKLVRSSATALQLSRKAARLCTVSCGCAPPITPCTMCGGRYSYVCSVGQESTANEPLSLLDPCFHPILSFNQDKLLSIYFENLLRSGEHFNTPLKVKFNRTTVTTPTKSQSTSTELLMRNKTNSTLSEHLKKQSRKLKKNAAARLTAKCRRNFQKRADEQPHDEHSSRESSSERLHSQRLPSTFGGFKKRRERSLSGSSESSSKPSSPVPSPYSVDSCSSQQGLHVLSGDSHHQKKVGQLQDLMRRKRTESDYDINNIVISYKMASSTRMEKLQYKEIITPKWRVLDIFADDRVHKNNGLVQPWTDEEEEDASEESYIRRHDRSEAEEKKRYMVGAPLHPALRVRSRSSRSDSRHDSSSGANTPDPLSPHPLELHYDSPLATPPPTPIVMHDEGSNSSFPPTSSQLLARRRTTSLSRRDRSHEHLLEQLQQHYRPNSPDSFEYEIIPPWAPRTFPIADQEVEEMMKHFVPDSNSQEEPDIPMEVDDNNSMEEEHVQADVTDLGANGIEPETSNPRSKPIRCSTPTSSSSIDEDPDDPEWTVSKR